MEGALAATNSWLAFHIFYQGSLDRLLVDCVKPLIAQLRRERRVSEYFFVRYWNGGPHLRLRVQPSSDPDPTSSAIVAALETFLKIYPGGSNLSNEEYSKQCAHMLTIEDRIHSPEVGEPLHEPDTVELRDYRFDTFRYGYVEESRAMTESHFCRSSEMAMFIVRETMDNIDARITIALYLSAALAGALDLGKRETSLLFAKASRLLSILYPAETGDLIASRGYAPYEDQRVQLDPLIAQLRNGGTFPDREDSLNKIMAAWQSEIRNKLTVLRGVAVTCKELPDPSYVALDYMHMMNNRLGIPVSQECYAYHLIAKAIEEVPEYS